MRKCQRTLFDKHNLNDPQIVKETLAHKPQYCAVTSVDTKSSQMVVTTIRSKSGNGIAT